jgi:hypothetical protein
MVLETPLPDLAAESGCPAWIKTGFRNSSSGFTKSANLLAFVACLFRNRSLWFAGSRVIMWERLREHAPW